MTKADWNVAVFIYFYGEKAMCVPIISTSDGSMVRVDWEDYDELKQYSWFIARGYVARKTRANGRQRIVYMHRHILGLKKGDGLYSDHKDRDPLNNRRRNLRAVNGTQNQANAGLRIDNKTGYRGVSRCGKKFRAVIKINRKSYGLGVFDTPEEAADVYNEAARDAFGEYAYQNQVRKIM